MDEWVPDLTGERTTAPPHILDLVGPLGGSGVAVVDSGGTLTYDELDARSGALAGALHNAGVRPGDAVVVHARLSRWAIVAMLGVLRAGARYVPVDAAFPAARRQMMAGLSGTRICVAEPDIGPQLPGLRHVSVQQPEQQPPHPWVRGAWAYTCFTSGSTGRPKDVTVSTTALGHSTRARRLHYGAAVSTFLLCSSISFDSSVAGIYWTLADRGCLVIPSDRPADPQALARAAQDLGASHMLLLPSLYGIVLRAGLAPRLRSLSTVIVAGEACPPGLVGQHFAQLPGTELHNEYGPTECTVWSTVHRCVPEDADRRDVPIGAPVASTRLYVRGPEGGPVPLGAEGELYIGGPGVATAGAPHQAAPLYRTGDLVSATPDGELRFHGRYDRQLKLGGVRVERGEIEQALLALQDVDEAAVGVGVVQGRAYVVGYVVPRDGTRIDPRQLRATLLTQLPAVAVPRRIDARGQLPRLSNGKTDYRALDEAAGQPPSAARTQGRAPA